MNDTSIRRDPGPPVTEFALTYVLTTRNKLEFLREVLARLLRDPRPDEEIVVVYGASSDGSVEYLRDLRAKGRIHQLISEPDQCQAHGANKGLLAARGTLIKVLTDDDVYYHSGIRRAKAFMLENPGVDLLIGETADVFLHDPEKIHPRPPLQAIYKNWMAGKVRAFWFGDQGALYRRSSLPLIGLWDTGVACIDVEQSVRLTALRQVRMAHFDCTLACALYNPASTTFSPGHQRRNTRDVRRIFKFYGAPLPGGAWWSRGWRKLKAMLPGGSKDWRPKSGGGDASAAFAACDRWLARQDDRLATLEIIEPGKSDAKA